MNKINTMFMLLLSICVISGCIEEKQEFFLNPDGSGKVIYEITTGVDICLDLDETYSSKQDEAIKHAADFLTLSEGVDAWKDINFKTLDDGRLYFKATAYFKKLSDVDIHGRIKALQNCITNLTKDEKGGMKLVFSPVREKNNHENKILQNKLSQKALANRIRSEKADFENKKEMLTAIFEKLKIERIFHLPGELYDVKVFKTDKKSNSVSILYRGSDILKAFDEITSKDNWWKKQILNGAKVIDGPSIEEVNESIFGEKALATAVVKGKLTPLFDYETEINSAKNRYNRMCTRLGLKKPAAQLQTAGGEGFNNLRIGGVQLVFESDEEMEVMPFYETKGFKLSLIGELPGTVNKIMGGKLIKAITDTNESLLPKEEWKQSINSTHLSTNGNIVIFQVQLRLPPKDMRLIKELSGELTCMVAAGIKKTDLGISSLEVGIKGDKFGAEVTAAGPSKTNQDKYEIGLNIKALRDEIKDIRFIGPDGQDFSEIQSSHTCIGFDNNLTYIFQFTKVLPSDTRIIVELHEGPNRFTIPFKLENVSLM